MIHRGTLNEMRRLHYFTYGVKQYMMLQRYHWYDGTVTVEFKKRSNAG
jgi:hypothetical protein